MQDLINNLSDSSVLDLDCDYKYTGSGNFSGITINKDNFTIDGHNHILDANAGNNNVRIFNITGNNVVLKSLNLMNANVKDEGSAIYNIGKRLFINNTSFINNTVRFGGAISNYGDNFTIYNSTFSDNIADGEGGAIWNFGDNFTVYNSNFSHNQVTNGSRIFNHYGGAIYNYQYCKGFNLVNSTFINNIEGKFPLNTNVTFSLN